MLKTVLGGVLLILLAYLLLWPVNIDRSHPLAYRHEFSWRLTPEFTGV